MANKDLRRQLMGGEVDESTHLHLGSDGVKQNRARQPAAATEHWHVERYRFGNPGGGAAEHGSGIRRVELRLTAQGSNRSDGAEPGSDGERVMRA
nr:hypothetical protein Iba_chr01aCG8310 [Ipomoea batatas]